MALGSCRSDSFTFRSLRPAPETRIAMYGDMGVRARLLQLPPLPRFLVVFEPALHLESTLLESILFGSSTC